jgi:hypothetical protein
LEKAGLYLSDNKTLEIDRNETFVPTQISEAIRGFVKAVNVSVDT